MSRTLTLAASIRYASFLQIQFKPRLMVKKKKNTRQVLNMFNYAIFQWTAKLPTIFNWSSSTSSDREKKTYGHIISALHDTVRIRFSIIGVFPLYFFIFIFISQTQHAVFDNGVFGLCL